MTQDDALQQLIYERKKENSIAFKCFIMLLTIAFFIATPIAQRITGVSKDQFWSNLWDIFTGPGKLVTDYFSLGCLASAMFNAGLCGLACTLIITLIRARANSTTFAAYILVIAHCFYGLNFVNMWPPFIGVLIYCSITKKAVRDNCAERMRTVLYRRAMLRIAEMVANREDCKALVTGDALGQVASQTVANMDTINRAIDLLVLRPLVGTDKLETIAVAERIRTMKLSSVQVPDSCTVFAPSNPATGVPVDLALKEEAKIPDYAQLLQKIVDDIEIEA